MRVTVRFVDGEQLDGEAEQVSLDRGGFTLVGLGGNTQRVWVGSGAIKYVVLHPGEVTEGVDHDPRENQPLNKVVLHFLDGEVLHTYEDEVFAEQPGGFTVQLWDETWRQLVKVLVSATSLKGVFFVDEWDSRSDDERRAASQEEEELVDKAVELVDIAVPELQGPMLVEEPALLAEPVLVEEPTLMELPQLADAPLLAIVVSDTEERRATFRSALTPRRMLVSTLPTPEERRYRLLRARIAEVLGAAGEARDETEAEPEEGPPGN